MGNKLSILFILLLFILNSCTDNDLESFSIGGNYIASQSSAIMLDTFTVKMSTVLVDSIPTSGPENLLAGKYQDDFLGNAGATSFFQIDLPGSVSVEKLTVFDSLSLVLHLTGMWYGDTLKPMTLHVHRLTQEMELVDDYYMYNTTTVQYDETPIGSVTFFPKPSITDSITIRLDDLLGNELFLMMKNSSDEISTSAKFKDYFKGIALVSDSGNDCVLGFTASDSLVNVVLDAHSVALERVDIRYSFSMASSGIYFNHFYFDRTGTPIENLKTQKEKINSSDSDDKTYLQGGAGILTRIDFPGLGKIMEIQRRFYFYKAELVFKPFPQSNSQVSFPTEMSIYSCDKFNRIGSEIQDSDGNSLVVGYNFDEFYHEENYYSLDITNYIKEELSDSYFNAENGLLINLPSGLAAGSFDRLVFDARESAKYKPVLKIYFLFYE